MSAMQAYTSAAMYQLHLLYAHLKLRLTFCPSLPLTLPCLGGAVDLWPLLPTQICPALPLTLPCPAFGRSICVSCCPRRSALPCFSPRRPAPCPAFSARGARSGSTLQKGQALQAHAMPRLGHPHFFGALADLAGGFFLAGERVVAPAVLAGALGLT
jgi:hypothetical protein